MQPIKKTEVWRTPNGTFAKAPEKIEVVEVEEPRGQGKYFYYAFIAYAAFLLLTPGWVIGLPIIGTAATIHSVHKIIQYKPTPRLIINKYW